MTDTPIVGDTVDLTYGSANFSTKNVGDGKPVTVSGITITGADAGDYAVSTTTTTTADITPASLVVGAIGKSKPYDGNTLASVTLTDNTLGADQVSVTDTGATFSNPSIGAGKAITVSGISISGADAANYVLADTTTTTTGDITNRSVASSAVSGTWSLPPAQPQSSVPGSVTAVSSWTTVSTPPAEVLDLSSQGGTSATSGLASSGAAGSSDAAGATAGLPSTSAQSSASTAGSAALSGAIGASNMPGAGGTTGALNLNGSSASSAAGANAASGGPNATASVAGANAVPSDSATAPDATTPSGAAAVDSMMAGPLPGLDSTEPATSVNQNISVTVSRTAAQTIAGVVTVLVPQSVIDNAVEFRFPLPTQLSGAVAKYDATQDVRVTTTTGKPLPSWLKFRASRGTFVATSMPMHALPMEVMVRTPTESWIVVISQKND